MKVNYPSLAQRYFATTLDVLIVIMLTISIVKLLTLFALETGPLWFVVFIPVLFYEPVLTAKFATVGQIVFKFRIREDGSLQRISIIKAYARLVVKLVLGIVSLFTIPNDRKRQAIHDKVLSTVAVKNGV